MPDRLYRVLAVAMHPVQYMTPIFRPMAKHPSLDFQVAYCTLRGAEASHDPEFGADIQWDVQWDVPLLDGYSWTHVPNRGSGAESFFALFNPRVWNLIRSGNYDAVPCFVGYVRGTFWIACLASKFSKAAFIFGADATSLTPRDGRNWKVPITEIFLAPTLWPGRPSDRAIRGWARLYVFPGDPTGPRFVDWRLRGQRLVDGAIEASRSRSRPGIVGSFPE